MSDKTTTWTITGSTDEEVRVQCDQNGMRARIRGELYAPAGRLEVEFSYGSNTAGKLYAKAEAARMFAQACDTAGDLEAGADEPLDVQDVRLSLVEGAEVSLAGKDAAVVVACYFEGATEGLIDDLQRRI